MGYYAAVDLHGDNGYYGLADAVRSAALSDGPYRPPDPVPRPRAAGTLFGAFEICRVVAG